MIGPEMDYGAHVFSRHAVQLGELVGSSAWRRTIPTNVEVISTLERWLLAGQAVFPLPRLLLMLVRMSPQIPQSRSPENFPACGFLAKQIFRRAASVAVLRPYGCSPCSFNMPDERSSQPR